MLKQLMLAPKAKERVRNILFSPSSYFYLAFSIFSLALIGYLFILQITWNGINAQVTYRSGNLTIDYFGDSSFEEVPKMGLLSAGDKIIEVDDLPVKSLVAAEYGLDKNRILLYLTAEDINELPRETPLKEGESAFLTGVKAATITIDMSQRVNKISTPPNNSSGSCHCELVPSGTTEKFKLDLLHLKYNIGQLAVIVILLFTALSFWFIGLFLYLVRPQQPITGQFLILCSMVALEIELYNSQFYYVSYFEKFVTILCNGFLGIVFLHFCLLFPQGQKLGTRVKNSLFTFYILSIALTAVRLLVTFQDLSPTRLTIEPIIRRIHNLELVSLFIVGLAILGIKYFSSKGQNRLRLRMAVYSIMFSISFPLIILIGYNFFGLWRELISAKFAFFFFPSILIPLTFAYAVMKNNLLGVGLRVRIFVVRLVLVTLVSLSYLFASTILTAVLPIWSDFSQQPLLLMLMLSVLVLILSQLQRQISDLVDRTFKVDRLNYTELNARWNNQLTKTAELPVIVGEILERLPADYHYKASALLLCHPYILSTLDLSDKKGWEKTVGKTSKTPETPGGESANLLLISDIIDNNLEDARNKENLPHRWVLLNPQFWSFLQAQKYVLVQDNTLPATIKKEFSDLELNNNSSNKGGLSFSVALPVKVGNEFYGALLLCEKSGEYIPVHEEIEQISNVANQIAVSFYNAMLLNQAVLQAEREKKLRRISELVISNEHKVRSRERFQLSEALHNDVLQELIAMGKNSRDNEVKNSLNQVINKIRLLNFELSPRNLEGDFIGELKRLVQHYQRKSSTIRIEDPLVEGDLLLLESVISIKHKEALYNAVKEIINNALKHSAASQIKLNIDFFPVTLQTDEVLEENDELLNLYNLHLEVEDDGIGLNPSRLQDIEQLVEEHHFGLNNLKWSIEKELGGKVLFYSELNRGMQVVIDFVLNTAQNQGNSELERLLQELDKDMFLKGQ